MFGSVIKLASMCATAGGREWGDLSVSLIRAKGDFSVSD